MSDAQKKTRREPRKAADTSREIPIYRLDGRQAGSLDKPSVLSTPVRHDIIKRGVLAVQSIRFQPQGRDPMAGKRTTAESMGVGRGMARIPRVKGRGTRRSGQGALAPGTVGGRLAHPPKAEKIIAKKINRKERKLAVRSAVAASASKELVLQRGHRIEKVKHIPLVVENRLETLRNTKALKEALAKLGLRHELERLENSRKIKAGRGKMRGRKMKKAKGPLIVVAEDKNIRRATSNIPGVDTSQVHRLNSEALAPGIHPGRLTIWSEAAFKKLKEGILG